MAGNERGLGVVGPMGRPMTVGGVLETCLYVDDLASATEFYTTVLGLEHHATEPGRHVFLRCGGAMLLLFIASETCDGSGEIPAHGAAGPGHVAFSVPSAELPAWCERLGRHGVGVEREIDWGNGRSVYFRDPAGNSLELATPRIWGLPE